MKKGSGMSSRVELGDQVKCLVTGLVGVVTTVSTHLNGCTRCGVQPPIDKDGKLTDAYWIDEPQLQVLKKVKIRRGPQNTGGPTTRVPAVIVPAARKP